MAVPVSASPSDALAVAIRAGHRRLPVHRGDLEGVVGCVRLRDLARAVDTGTPDVVEDLVRPVLRVRSDALIADLLDLMQRSGLRLALAVDGEDRVRGLVTIEDIVAELVGEIEELD